MAAGSTYTPIATTTLGSAQASYTFSSISGSYTDLVLVCSMALNAASNPTIQFNSDTASNYSDTWVGGSGSVAASGRQTSVSAGLVAGIGTGYSPVIINIMNYSNTTTYKTYLSRGSATDQSGQNVSAWAGLWRSTAAINSITILPGGASTISAGSTFTIYGVLNA